MSALADVSIAIDGLDVTVTITRYNAGSYVEGRWVEGSTSTFDVKGSLQVLRPEEMLRLEEGQRLEATRKFYTKTKLQSAEVAAGTRADRFDYLGDTYEVLSVGDWNDLGGYYKIIVTRAGQ